MNLISLLLHWTETKLNEWDFSILSSSMVVPRLAFYLICRVITWVNDREVHLLTYNIIDMYGKWMNSHKEWSLKSLDWGFTNYRKWAFSFLIAQFCRPSLLVTIMGWTGAAPMKNCGYASLVTVVMADMEPGLEGQESSRWPNVHSRLNLG